MPFANRARSESARRYHVEPTVPLGDPVYLGTPERPWFAWHHVAGGGAALVIVPPFGHEALGAHRSLRHLAIRAAAAGIAAWRIDLDGTGDSAGDDLDPDRVAAWCASISATVDAARAAGASRVFLLGIRLGALLATRVAAERGDVDGLFAIVPVISGRKWLREMRALQGALGVPPPPAGARSDEGDEILGFAMTPQTRDELTAIDLEKLARSPAPHVCVIDRSDMAPNEKWLAHLRALGADVTHASLPGYVDMVADAHKAEVPEQIVAAVLDHAKTWSTGAERTTARAPSYAREARIGSIVEEPVTISGLSAIVSRPTTQVRPRAAVILLNAGAVRRVGPNRMYVTIARRCAADGVLVVRADLSGLGDSPAQRDAAEKIVYGDTMVPDVAALAAWCRAAGAQQIGLAGLCSGGFYAMEAAILGERIAAMIPINPGAADLFAYQAAEDTERYRGSVRDAAKWKKLLSGQVDMRRLARSLWSRARGQALVVAERAARRLGRPLPSDRAARFVATVASGVQATLVVCATDPALPYLRDTIGELWPRLERAGFVLRVIDGPDHTFTPRWSQYVLADEISAAVRRLG
jgi:dienelactone hydrolase